MSAARVPNDRAASEVRIDQFFSGPAARADRWRTLLGVAARWADGNDNRASFETMLAGMAATEGYYAYPGLALMDSLREAASEDDAHAAHSMVQRINSALATKSFRRHSSDREIGEETDSASAESLPIAGGDGGARRLRLRARVRRQLRRRLLRDDSQSRYCGGRHSLGVHAEVEARCAGPACGSRHGPRRRDGGGVTAWSGDRAEARSPRIGPLSGLQSERRGACR